MKRLHYLGVAYCLLLSSSVLGAASSTTVSEISPELQVIRVDNPTFMLDGLETLFLDKVTSLAFSPNGSLLALVTSTGVANLYCAQTGQLMYELKPSSIRAVKIPNYTREYFKAEWGREVRFSPDGELIAAGFNDGNVYIWNTASCELQSKLGGTDQWALSLAFNPNSCEIAAGYTNGGICIWDIASRLRTKVLRHASHDMNNINTLDYSADGSMLASGSTDSTVHVWRTATWECLQRLYHEGEQVYAVKFDPWNHILVSGTLDSKKIRIWDAVSGTCIKTLHKKQGCAQTLALSQDSTKIASGSCGKVELFDAAKGSNPHEIKLHKKHRHYHVDNIAFHQNNKVIAVAAGNTVQFLPLP